MVTSDERWFTDKLGFNRGVLRKSEKFIEKDFTKINPRELHRKTRRKIQDLSREEDKLKFEIKTDPINISKESVGDASGYARGGIKAHFERPDHDGGVVEYHPYRSLGAKLAGLGVLATAAVFVMMQLMQSPPDYLPMVGVLGIATMVGGVAGYLYSEYETFNVILVSKLRSLLLGEVTEEKIEQGDKTQTQVQGDITMMVAADTDIELYGNKKYRRVLDKKDVKNARALADRIDELRDSIYQDMYLDHYEDIEEPRTEQEVNEAGWQELRRELSSKFSVEEVNRWFTAAMRERGAVEDHVVEQLEDDVRTVKQEAEDLADEIDDYVEKN